MNGISHFFATLALVAVLCAVAEGGPPGLTTTHPFPGITLTEQTRVDPPLRLHWVQADLGNPAIHLRVCSAVVETKKPWETTLMTVSKIAEREKLDIAVNGSFFAPRDFKVLFGRKIPYFEGNPAQACGWTISDGRLWSANPISATFPTLAVWRDGRVTIGDFATAPRYAIQAVSGCATLVRNGRNVGDAGTPAPRTAAGLDKLGKTLTLLVVDGRRADQSVGLSMRQTADEMIRLGCFSAINLDSGGSSTLVVRRGEKWSVLNTPSDGHDLPIPLSVERAVANALGISVDPAAGSK